MRHVVALSWPCVLVAGTMLAVGGCGSQRAAANAHLSDSSALTKLYVAVEAHPDWATTREVAAARAASNFAPGSNARCSFQPQSGAPLRAHFICSLLPADASGPTQRHYLLTENANGSEVTPITSAQLKAQTAYDRRRVSRLVAAHRRGLVASTRADGKTLAGRPDETLAGQLATQPRVHGTACYGNNGMEHATPMSSATTPGGYLVAGKGTSCTLAQVVATAFGDEQTQGSTIVTVPDRATGSSVTLRCRGLSSSGPVDCTGGGNTVYLGSDAPPL